MASKNDKRSKIINKAYVGYKSNNNEHELNLFKKLAADSKECGFEDLNLMAEGFLSTIEKKYQQAIEQFEQSLTIDGNLAFSWQGLGRVYYNQSEHQKAKESYQKAIEADDKFVHAWNGLGNINAEQKNYKMAEEAYLKAIEIDDHYSNPWTGIGITYRSQNKLVKAEEALQKAIEIEEDCDLAWNALANVYGDQKKYELAEEAYLTAVEIGNDPAHIHRNTGLLYLKTNKLNKAVNHFKKSLSNFDSPEDDYWISVTSNNLESALDKLKEQSALEQLADESDGKDPLASILAETSTFEDEVYANQQAFQSFVEKVNVKENDLTFLKVLRRWNSYTPIIADNYHISKGGGYFIKFKGKGIVIDPGFNFIDNFKGSDHLFDEIDVVMITHAHNDHTSDLESILTLLNNYNKNQKGLEDFEGDQTIRSDIAKRRKCRIKKVTETEINEAYYGGSNRRKTLDIYMPNSVAMKFTGMFKLRSKEDYRCHIIEKGDVKQLLGNNLQLTVIGAKHDDIISDRDSVGFVFEFNDTALVYTGDTGWNHEIKQQYEKINKEVTGKHIVLLAHLGGFKESEKKYITDGESSGCYYKNHLGRLGLARLVQVLQPKVCFISEFGEELRMHRQKLAEIYDKAFDSTKFFPADIDLEYCLKEHKIMAISSLDFEKNKCASQLTDLENVKTCQLNKDYSLHYYDKEAPFQASDLVQVLMAEFERSSH